MFFCSLTLDWRTKAAATNIVFMKKGQTEVIEHQYINQHLHQRTEYYEAVGSNSTLEQNSESVTI
jgi:hypothetical protein